MTPKETANFLIDFYTDEYKLKYSMELRLAYIKAGEYARLKVFNALIEEKFLFWQDVVKEINNKIIPPHESK